MFRRKLIIPVVALIGLASFSCFVSKDEAKGTDYKKNISEVTSYNELYRPQYHFSQPEGNLADPNGLIFYKGEYHLFHQQNGTWAHAISKDLTHWKHMPVAFGHDKLGQAISGSAVVDWNDTSGFFDGKSGLVAIFTNTLDGLEQQSLAYSKDNGRTWTKYKGNPVIPNNEGKDFRDPKVFWHEETKQWVMVVSTNQSVTFYGSKNLKKWTRMSRFGDQEGSHVAVWECPDLFQLPVDDSGKKKWVLHVSVGDNDETNGSTAQYFIGEFDGKEFKNDNGPETVLTTDVGQDFYAGQTFSDIPKKDGRRIWIGWMSNWRYPYQSPTSPWMGNMSIPRELKLRTMENGEIKLVQEPVDELKQLRATTTKFKPFTFEGNKKITNFKGSTFEFEAEMTWKEIRELGIRVRQGDSGKEHTDIGLDVKNHKVFIDRTNAGLKELIDRNGKPFAFGSRHETDYPKNRKKIKIHGFVDESSVEVFINDGEQTFTNLIYTNPANRGIELYSKGGKVRVDSLQFHHLNSIWRDKLKKDKLERITLSEQAVVLKIGEKKDVQAVAKPDWLDYKGELKWEVTDRSIVKVSTEARGSEGTLGGLKIGNTTIKISDKSGKVITELPVSVLGN
ncbi:glycoside hydrolase family 32 protein [Priestia aryabhattai]|uniref:glycoside hydrolase family 32 protein n=1 Tax=Priestia aryabhattai TaxID=412384 RepID=UPI003F8B6C50